MQAIEKNKIGTKLRPINSKLIKGKSEKEKKELISQI